MADAAVFERIRERFPYVFAGGQAELRLVAARDRAAPVPRPVPDRRRRDRAVPAAPWPWHRRWGFRIGRFAYSTDTDGLDEQAFDDPAGHRGLDRRLPCATARTRAMPISSSTLAWIDRVGPAQAYLTHMNHEVDYADWCGRLPTGVLPAHDGLVIEIAD